MNVMSDVARYDCYELISPWTKLRQITDDNFKHNFVNENWLILIYSHWSLFRRVWLMRIHQWFRWWFGTEQGQAVIEPNDDTVQRRIHGERWGYELNTNKEYRRNLPKQRQMMCKNGHPWWRHQMETFSALLGICAGNSPVSGEFPAQRPVTRSFDIFFDLRLNKSLSKQSWSWWFEMLSCPLWRQCIGEGSFFPVCKWNSATFICAFTA